MLFRSVEKSLFYKVSGLFLFAFFLISRLLQSLIVGQNSFGPQSPYFGGWQGNGWRRTGRTPTDVNAASRQKTAVGACIPLSTEGK